MNYIFSHTASVCSVGCLLDHNKPTFLSRFSRRAKELLGTYKIDPPPKVIEVDLRGMIKISTMSESFIFTLLQR